MVEAMSYYITDGHFPPVQSFSLSTKPIPNFPQQKLIQPRSTYTVKGVSDATPELLIPVSINLPGPGLIKAPNVLIENSITNAVRRSQEKIYCSTRTVEF